MSEKEIEKLLEQVNNLSLTEFSNLCLRVVKKIVNRKPAEETVENNIHRPDLEVLVKLMIENDIKIDEE